MSGSFNIAQLQQKVVESAQKVAALKDQPKAPNGVLTREALALTLEMESIDWQKLLDEVLFKPLETAKSATPADLAMDSFWIGVMTFPKMLEQVLKESRRLSKEHQKKIDEAVKEAIDESLKAKGMTLNSVITQLALRAQDWLFSPQYVSFDSQGRIQKTGLNRVQKAHTQKYLFAHKLPTKSDGTLDFKRFSNYQAKRFAFYMQMYAKYNPPFKAYVQESMESILPRKEIEKMGRFAAQMVLSSSAPNRQVFPSLVRERF